MRERVMGGMEIDVCVCAARGPLCNDMQYIPSHKVRDTAGSSSHHIVRSCIGVRVEHWWMWSITSMQSMHLLRSCHIGETCSRLFPSPAEVISPAGDSRTLRDTFTSITSLIPLAFKHPQKDIISMFARSVARSSRTLTRGFASSARAERKVAVLGAAGEFRRRGQR